MKLREPPLKTWLIFLALLVSYFWRPDWAIPCVVFLTFLQVQFLREEVTALRRLAEPHIDPDTGDATGNP